MKIAVQNQLIDTDNIYLIGEIIENEKEFKFVIESFNGKNLTISIPNSIDIKPSKKVTEYEHLKNIIKEEDRSTEINDILTTLWKEIELENKSDNKVKLEKLRQDVAKVWYDNQSNVPTFNINNY